MKIKKGDFLYIIINILFCILSISMAFLLDNKMASLPIIGVCIIGISFFMILRYRKTNTISLLIGIIALISISFAYSICFNTYDTAFNWQIKLLNYESNIINAKNYLIFISFLSLFIGNIKTNKNNEIVEMPRFDYNPLILAGSIIILIYALIFGLDRGSIGTYTSNTNVIYEYALIVFIFAWQYAKDNRLFKTFLIGYAILYFLQGLLYGDRSSAFPMVLLLLMFYSKNSIKMENVILVGLVGIFGANIIDIFRNSGTLFSYSILKETASRGLFVNTISYSFYGGTQIIRYGMELSINQKMIHLLNYALSILKGGSNKYSLTTIANNYGFINKGGGMSLTYFYFWGNYLGTMIFAFIMGKIIKHVFTHNNKMCNVFKITLTIFTIRWFLYYPTAFFRTALFVPAVYIFLTEFVTKMIKKKKEV